MHETRDRVVLGTRGLIDVFEQTPISITTILPHECEVHKEFAPATLPSVQVLRIERSHTGISICLIEKARKSCIVDRISDPHEVLSTLIGNEFQPSSRCLLPETVHIVESTEKGSRADSFSRMRSQSSPGIEFLEE